MLNVADKNGDTPLHIAIQHGQLSCFTYLMDQGANTNLLNNSMIAPIHQCVISNQPLILDALISHPSRPNIYLTGVYGINALHYCALKDNLECAQVLAKYNCKLCVPCNNGFMPIHVATHQNSIKVLEFLIGEGWVPKFNS